MSTPLHVFSCHVHLDPKLLIVGGSSEVAKKQAVQIKASPHIRHPLERHHQLSSMLVDDMNSEIFHVIRQPDKLADSLLIRVITWVAVAAH